MRLFSPRLCLFHVFRRQSARYVILASWGGVRSQSAWRVCSVNLALSLRGLGLGFGLRFLGV